MKTNRQKWSVISNAIKSKYVWPGGYPMYIIMSDCRPICMDCAEKERDRLVIAYREKSTDGWQPIAVDINDEDQDCYCDHCGKQIESAYGEGE